MTVSLYLVGVTRWGTHDHCQVVGIEVYAESCLDVKLTTALAYDLTELDPPAQVHEVDQTKVELLSEVTVVHCDPEVAADSPHKSW